jgi:hypothetical protein
MTKPKSFRSLVPEQTLLSSPLLIDWLPEGHLVFFPLELPTGLDFEVFWLHQSTRIGVVRRALAQE